LDFFLFFTLTYQDHKKIHEKYQFNIQNNRSYHSAKQALNYDIQNDFEVETSKALRKSEVLTPK
jgi:hypothetical protein